MSVLCQDCHDTIAQDEYTQTPPNIPEYATIISINSNKNKDNKSYRTEATIACRSRSPSAEKEKRKISPLVSRNLALLENKISIPENRSRSPTPILTVHNMDSNPKSPPTPPPMRNSSATTSNTTRSRKTSGDSEKITHFPSNRRISRDTTQKNSTSSSFLSTSKLSTSSQNKKGRNCVEPGCYDVTGLPHNGFHASTNSRQGKNDTKVFTISDDQGSNESYGTGKNSPDPIMDDSYYR